MLRADEVRGVARRGVAFLAAVAAAVWILTTGNDYHLLLASQFCAYVLGALSLNLIFGYAHQAVLAQGALIGIGAYGFALGVRSGLPMLLAGSLSVMVGAVVGGLLALATLRWSGLGLALVALAVQFAFSGLAVSWTAVTGGIIGREVPAARDLSLAGLSVRQTWFVISAGLAILIVVLCARWLRTVAGRVLTGLREAGPAAQSLGAQQFSWNLATFVIAGAIAALAGVLLCGQSAFVSPGSYSVVQTILYAFGVIVGGLASVGGSVLGAAFVLGLPELLGRWDLAEWQRAAMAIGAVGALVTMPHGLVAIPRRLSGVLMRIQRRRTPRLSGPESQSSDVVEAGSHRLPIDAAGSSAREEGVRVPSPVPASRDVPAVELLAVRELEAGYGRSRILYGVDLTLRQGEVIAVIGANGAGKSTLLRAIAGQIPIWHGDVRLEGRPVRRTSTSELVRSGLSLVPADRGLHDALTVLEHLRLGGITLPRRVADARVAEIQERFPDLARPGTRVSELSGGQRQLLAICRALVSRPKVLLLDEPSVGLSPALVDAVLGTIRQICVDGVGAIVVEQNVRAALEFSDRCVLLQNGRVQRDDPSAVYLEAPDLIAEQLIGTISTLDGPG